MSQRPRPKNDDERITLQYSEMLAEIVREQKLTKKELIGPGCSPQVIWRVLEFQEYPSLAAAAKVRKRILELRKGLDIPPPNELTLTRLHYEWMRIGTELALGEADELEALLRIVRKLRADLVDGRRALLDLKKSSV